MSFNFDKMYCGAIRRGDIFLYEPDNNKKTTVLVLQDNVLNDGLPTVICALVKPFSKGDEVFANEVILNKNEIGLGADGICMLHKIFTVEREFLVAKKGEIKKETLDKVYKALDINLGRFRDAI